MSLVSVVEFVLNPPWVCFISCPIHLTHDKTHFIHVHFWLQSLFCHSWLIYVFQWTFFPWCPLIIWKSQFQLLILYYLLTLFNFIGEKKFLTMLATNLSFSIFQMIIIPFDFSFLSYFHPLHVFARIFFFFSTKNILIFCFHFGL